MPRYPLDTNINYPYSTNPAENSGFINDRTIGSQIDDKMRELAAANATAFDQFKALLDILNQLKVGDDIANSSIPLSKLTNNQFNLNSGNWAVINTPFAKLVTGNSTTITPSGGNAGEIYMLEIDPTSTIVITLNSSIRRPLMVPNRFTLTATQQLIITLFRTDTGFNLLSALKY